MTSEQKPDAGAPSRGSSAQPSRPFGLLAASIVGIGLVGAIALYGMQSHGGKPTGHTGACAKSLDVADTLAQLVHGEVAALTPSTAPIDLSRVSFDDSAGHKTTIGAFKGRTILLNLWATWCIPCRAEMPSLDKLQSALGSPRFQVVAVDVDTARLDKPPAFLKEIGATNLATYSDHTADILQSLKQVDPIEGLPTSIIVGPDGCAIGTMNGPAKWDSNDAKALIDRASS